jgi:hypothetical protein
LVRDKAWHKAHPPDKAHHAAQQRRYYFENPEKRKSYFRQYRFNYPERIEAAWKVQYAIRLGRISKADSCFICRKKDVRIEAHHYDYAKPLDVTWICRSCHVKIHKESAR